MRTQLRFRWPDKYEDSVNRPDNIRASANMDLLAAATYLTPLFWGSVPTPYLRDAGRLFLMNRLNEVMPEVVAQPSQIPEVSEASGLGFFLQSRESAPPERATPSDIVDEWIQHRTNSSTDALTFWSVSSHPLVGVARALLSVPASSVDSERTFSHSTAITADQHRSSLDATTLAQLTLAKNNRDALKPVFLT